MFRYHITCNTYGYHIYSLVLVRVLGHFLLPAVIASLRCGHLVVHTFLHIVQVTSICIRLWTNPTCTLMDFNP